MRSEGHLFERKLIALTRTLETHELEILWMSLRTLRMIAHSIFVLRFEKSYERSIPMGSYSFCDSSERRGFSSVSLWYVGFVAYHFQHVTCNIAASEYEVTALGALTLDVIEQVNLGRIIALRQCFAT